MNYGYAPIDEDMLVVLRPADEQYRFFMQLYYHTIKGIDISGMDLLEIGCGRGGGAYFLKHYLRPKSVIGLDYSKKAIKFCRQKYSEHGLSFIYGDAEALPFKSKSFNIVVNVESSHCYISKSKFFREVARVLKKGGYFCYADLCDTDKYHEISKLLHSSKMNVVKEEDITQNVIQALEMDSERRLKFFKQTLPKKINTYYFKEFAGHKGSSMYNRFKSKKVMYFYFLMCKT